jgi:hypothetical protein
VLLRAYREVDDNTDDRTLRERLTALARETLSAAVRRLIESGCRFRRSATA